MIFSILIILVLITIQEVYLPQQGIQFKQVYLTLDPNNIFIGTISKYCPFCNITNLGEVLRNESQAYLLTLARDQITRDIIIIQYVTFQVQNQKIVHTITIKTNLGIISHDFIIDPITYEGTWFVSYIQIKQEKILIGIMSQNSLQEEEFKFDQLIKNQFQLSFGGGLNFFDEGLNTNYLLSSFTGELGFIINEDKDFIINILKSIEQSTTITQNYLLDYGNYTSINYQQIITPLQYHNTYSLSFWVKINLITNLEQTVYVIRIMINSQINFIGKVGSNSFILNYKFKNDQWYYYIEYYSFDYPYILDELDQSKFTQSYNGILDQQILVNWHLIKITYDQNILSFTLLNYLSINQIINNFNSRQYSDAKIRIYLGGNAYESTNAQIEIAQLIYYNGDDSTQNYCHYSCHTCIGPFNYQCTSCSDNSFRVYNEITHTCSCQLWYIDDNKPICQGEDINNLIETKIFLPSDPRYDSFDPELICAFGYFKFDDECYQCPSASSETSLYCSECLLNPNTWIFSGKCIEYYVQKSAVYQQIVAASTYQQQFFLINDQLFACGSCSVCQLDAIMQPEKSGCFLYPQQHINQDVYITCAGDSIFNEETQNCVVDKQISPLGRFICNTFCGYCFLYVCYYCIDNEQYFLDREQICRPCTIKNCKYCFQYNIYDNNQISTRVQSASESFSTDPEDYALGCSLCYEGYIFDFSTSQCVKSILPSDCKYGYTQFDGNIVCTSIVGPTIPKGIVEFINCQQYISFCQKCVKDNFNMLQCVQCQQGYYLNIDSFTCFPCSTRFSDTIECEMVSAAQDNWKFEVQSILMNFCPDHNPIYLLLNWQRDYFITECIDGYEQITNYNCVKTCGANCQKCVAQNGVLECQKCWFQQQEYEQFSYFNDQCDICPYPCQFCLPRTSAQILAINPYFQFSESQTYQCMLNFNNSSTFIEQLTGQTKQKNIDNQRYQVEIQQRYFSKSAITDIQNIDYLKRRKISVVVDKYTSLRNNNPDNLRQQIFWITNSTIIYDGTNATQQSDSVNFNNQTQVNLQNINYLSESNQIFISSLYGVTVLISNLTIQSAERNTSSIQIKNLNNMTIDKLELINVLLDNTTVIETISMYTNYQINLKINNVVIKNCTFRNSSLLSFNFNNVYIQQLAIKELNIFDSNFESSNFINEINQINSMKEFMFRKVNVTNCNFTKSSFFLIQVADSISLSQLFFFNLQLVNSTLIEANNSIQLDLFHAESIILIQSYLLKIGDSELYSSYHHYANDIQLIDINFSGNYPIIFSHNKYYTTSFTMTNINFRKIQFEDDLYNQVIGQSCLIYLQIGVVRIQNLEDDKSFGYKDFCIKESKSINVFNCSISNNAFEQTKKQLLSQQEFLRIENFQSLTLSDILLESQFILNDPLISINFKTNNQDEQQIVINNTKFINNLSLKSKQFQISTLLYISSTSYCVTSISNSTFINNTIIHQLQDLQIISPGLIFIQTFKSFISITGSMFYNNEIQNTTYSLIQLDSDEIIFSQLSISETNYATFSQNQNINNGIIQSVGGFSFIIGSIVMVYDTTFKNSIASKGGCLYIKTKDQGQITLQNVEIYNSSSYSYGGSFVIDCSISESQIKFQNMKIFNSISKEEGGFIYLMPSHIQNKIILSSIMIQNSIAKNSALFELNCPHQSKNNYFELNNIHVEIQQSAISEDSEKSLNDIRGFIIVRNSQIKVINFQYTGVATLPILYLEYSRNLLMANIFFNEVTIMDTFLVFISNFISIQSQMTNSTLQFQNFSIQESKTVNSIITAFIVCKIAQSENFHQIKMFKVEFLKNNCSTCSKGLLQIASENNKIKYIQFDELKLFQNICGSMSCLVLSNDSLSYSNQKLNIKRSRFISNNASLGGALNSNLQSIIIEDSLCVNNMASQKGGALFINGTGETLIFKNTQFIHNKADIGGAIYLQAGILNPNNFNNILFLENKALSSINNLKEQPSLIELNLFGQEIDTISIKDGYGTPNMLQKYIYFPSGQSIGSYQFSQQGNLNMKIYAVNKLREKQIDLADSTCLVESVIILNNSNIQEGDSTNNQIFAFNQEQQSFDLSNLMIVLDPYDQKYIKFSITCDCLYDQSFTLIFQAKSYKCQMGEYYYESKCLQCDADKGYYSVQYKATNCQKVDPKIIKSNTAKSIQLNSGYWRPNQQNPYIQKCQNNFQACLGGWEVADDSCLQGYIGALCEECDIYNSRGQGQYYKNQSLECTECGSFVGKIFFSIFIICLQIFHLFQEHYFLCFQLLIVQILYLNHLKDLNLLHVIMILYLEIVSVYFYLIIDQSAALIKMIMNYLQILVGIKSFRLVMFINIIDILIPISNPVSGSTFSFDCFYSQQISIKIIYVDLIINIFLPIFYFLLFITIYLILIYLKKTSLSQTIYFTALLYILFYTQPNMIKELSLNLAERTISNIGYINKNVQFLYNTQTHMIWMKYYIIPLFLILGIFVPIFLLFVLFLKRRLFHSEKVRQYWGYVYNDYQRKSYFWEIFRILQREIVILSLAINQERIIINGIIIFIVLFCYYSAATIQRPFNINSLNQFELKSILICQILILISTLKYQVQYSEIQYIDIPLQIIFVIILIYFIYTIVVKMISVYYNKYSERLDHLRLMIRKQFPKITYYCPILKRHLQLKKEQKQRVIQRFNLIKNYLHNSRQLFHSGQIQNSQIQRSQIHDDSHNHTRQISRNITQERNALIVQVPEEIY